MAEVGTASFDSHAQQAAMKMVLLLTVYLCCLGMSWLNHTAGMGCQGTGNLIETDAQNEDVQLGMMTAAGPVAAGSEALERGIKHGHLSSPLAAMASPAAQNLLIVEVSLGRGSHGLLFLPLISNCGRQWMIRVQPHAFICGHTDLRWQAWNGRMAML